jgi:transcription elongation factor Elf1
MLDMKIQCPFCGSDSKVILLPALGGQPDVSVVVCKKCHYKFGSVVNYKERFNRLSADRSTPPTGYNQPL